MERAACANPVSGPGEGWPVAPDCWVFDVDGTLVDAMTATSLRPGARRILEHLRALPTRVVWWSAGGADYAGRRAAALDVRHLVDEFHGKDKRGPDGRYLTDHFLGAGCRAVFVDDCPEDLPLGASGVAVFPYIAANPHDKGLGPVAKAAGMLA